MLPLSWWYGLPLQPQTRGHRTAPAAVGQFKKQGGLVNLSQFPVGASYVEGAVQVGRRWQLPAAVEVQRLHRANLFTEPYLLTGGGGPNGASSSPVLIMCQQGIQQGKPGYAAAIGIVLVIGVLIIAFLQNRFAGGRD